MRPMAQRRARLVSTPSVRWIEDMAGIQRPAIPPAQFAEPTARAHGRGAGRERSRVFDSVAFAMMQEDWRDDYATSACSLTPSARATFSTVAKLGLPSALSAL